MECSDNRRDPFAFLLVTCAIGFVALLLFVHALEWKIEELKEQCKAEAAKTNSEWMFLSSRGYECKIKINGSWER